MWGLFNANDYLVSCHRLRSECIRDARGFWGAELTWRSIKSRYGWYVARVVVTKEADCGCPTDRLDHYIAAKLKADGYGGLCGDDCGCELDDLMPCGNVDPFWCRPGYLHKCEDCPNEPDECPIEDGGEGWCIGPKKGWPEAREEE